MSECKHCKFLNDMFSDDEIKTNREYWMWTEMFVYMHKGRDYCPRNYNIYKSLKLKFIHYLGRLKYRRELKNV